MTQMLPAPSPNDTAPAAAASPPARMTAAEARALAAEIERDAFSYVRAILQATDSQGRPIVEVVDLLTTQRHQIASPAEWQQLHARLRGTARAMAKGATPSAPGPLAAAPTPAPEGASPDATPGEEWVAFTKQAAGRTRHQAARLRTEQAALGAEILRLEREAAALDAALTAWERVRTRTAAGGATKAGAAAGGRVRTLQKPPGVGPLPARWEPLAREYAAAHGGLIDVAALAALHRVAPSRIAPTCEKLVRRGQAELVDVARYQLLTTQPAAEGSVE